MNASSGSRTHFFPLKRRLLSPELRTREETTGADPGTGLCTGPAGHWHHSRPGSALIFTVTAIQLSECCALDPDTSSGALYCKCRRKESNLLSPEGHLVYSQQEDRPPRRRRTGAATGNRTRVSDLASQCLTSRRQPRVKPLVRIELTLPVYETGALPLSYRGKVAGR